MVNQKRSYVLLTVIIVLAVVCLIQAVVIFRNAGRGLTSHDFENDESFSSALTEKFKKERDDQWGLLDRFFSDDFFRKRNDPFTEIDEFHQRMNRMMREGLGPSFENSWDAWFSNRFLGGGGDVEIHTEENADSYVITLEVPNLKDNKLNITINEDGISIEGELTQIAERKDAKGNVLSRQEVHRSISQQFPIPHDADHEGARIDNKGDAIEIILPKVVS
jgi:HSP20 family molecular chaperone IbpA